MYFAVDVLGFFSISNTTRSGVNLNFFEASIRSTGKITRRVVRSMFGGRLYIFSVRVSI